MSGQQFTSGPWALNRLDSAEEFARLQGKELLPHEGYYRTNSGAWIVTCTQTDEEGFQVGSPVCEVTFKGSAKRGEAYKAPDPEGQANARLIAAAPSLYADAEFLCARIRELEGEMRDDDDLSRQYFGHVLPALARMESALGEARGETL
jgi:hypothetical protein